MLSATNELRKIVQIFSCERNEVLRAVLSLQAYKSLLAGIEETSKKSLKVINIHQLGENIANNTNSIKGSILRVFFANVWVTLFHDVDTDGDIDILEQVANNQV